MHNKLHQVFQNSSLSDITKKESPHPSHPSDADKVGGYSSAQLTEEHLQIADFALITWQQVELKLASIIGRRGVVALYQKALTKVVNDYQWLTPAQEAAFSPCRFQRLRSVLLNQKDPSNARRASESLINTFYDNFSTFFGSGLASQLLHGVVQTPENSRNYKTHGLIKMAHYG